MKCRTMDHPEFIVSNQEKESIPTYNHATTKLAIPSNETSQDKLSKV